jgi:hypothetical protein
MTNATAKILPDGMVKLVEGDTSIILARDQIGGLADMVGFSPIERAAIPLIQTRKRLGLMVAMVRAHTTPGDPLRTAVDALDALESADIGRYDPNPANAPEEQRSGRRAEISPMENRP